MKFGPVTLTSALGAVLAHSMKSSKGRLRKGHVLTSDDLQSLAAAGHDTVIVAALDENDVDENTAAARLAEAVKGQGVKLTAPFTGRVNLIAEGPGVAVLDVGALEAVNAGDPMITIATVPPMQQMSLGGMVATIKIISYAVSQQSLATAVAAAGASAISIHPPILRTATLIISEIPGGAGSKGRAAIEGRLEALDVQLEEVLVVPHELEPLTQAITTVKSDLTLIVTGSATSDPEDVGPSALRAAGGEVIRFGMPVDPGNLLFLGDLASKPVIGLPGCARSPALNGADWVLARVICGVPVSGSDIAAMGVGGLLKEIPTRPQPRKG